MVIGQSVRLIVNKLNTKYGAIGKIVHIYREGVYEVEFKDIFNHITSETLTDYEIEAK